MIIGNSKIDLDTIHRFSNSPEALVNYTIDLVPIWARHVEAIVNNQRYYVALYVRRMLTIPYYNRKAMIDALTYGIKVYGIVNEFITIYELLDQCNTKSLLEMLENLRDER